MTRRNRTWFARMVQVVSLMLLATACNASTGETTIATTTPAEDGGAGQAAAVSIIYVGCAAPSGFHGIVAAGAQTAADNLGNVEFQYVFPEEVTAAGMAPILETAIAARPDGIALCGLDPSAHRSLVEEGVTAGIFFSLTPSDQPYAEHPLRDPEDLYISRVGSDEFSAGVLSGQQILVNGVSSGKVVCAPNPDDQTQFQRCDGVQSVVGEAGLDFEIVEMTEDPGRNAELLTTYLRANTDVSAAITTNLQSYEGMAAAVKELGLNDLVFGAFDLFEPVLAGIQEGTVLWTIDQQPWWRGYVPTWDLVMKVRYGLQRANWFLTGPAITDANNIDAVLAGVEAGYR
ncbi:MAG TPA: substrate-binding domain-containing protein [Thermoleophilia bacterium]|nr:substrate-binding domain-containing protein [Thermoleophilia bacterium]